MHFCYLHFSSSKKTEIKSASPTDANTAGPFKIAYFEMDSIENNYEYLKDVRNELKGENKSVKSKIWR